MDILHSFVHCLLHLQCIFTVRTHHNLDEPHFQAQWPYVANGYHTGKSRTNISIIADSSMGQCGCALFITSWEFLALAGWGVAWVELLILNYQGG